jgi:predicted nucleotidyltransferase
VTAELRGWKTLPGGAMCMYSRPVVAAKNLDRDALVRSLRAAGARFAFLHGSQVSGTAREGSDVDVAAHFGGRNPAPWELGVPPRVDLVVLDSASLELGGRVALHGELLFDDDPSARVAWQAKTRLMYLDEEARQKTLDRVFLEGRRRGR